MDFVNEGKLEKERERKQAEWERVRKAEDPIEAPAEVFDNRTLYDKLKEQHEIKKGEHDSTHSLKNMVRGLDCDELEFLDDVHRAKRNREKELALEEKKELDEVKKALCKEQKFVDQPKLTDLPNKKTVIPTHKKENKQSALLANAVKRKHSAITSASLKTNEEISILLVNNELNEMDEVNQSKVVKRVQESKSKSQIVVGILPGIGDYDSDSSSNSSSDDDEEEKAIIDNDLFNKGVNKGDRSVASKLVASDQ